MAKERFVAVILTGDLPRYREAHEAFVNIFRSSGMNEEKVRIYVQTPNPDPMSWANSVRKAVAVEADLIVTYGAPATLIAKKESRNVPVLFADVYDPVSLGIARTLDNPGAGMTGVSCKTPLSTLVRTFSLLRPMRIMGVLYSSNDQSSMHQVRELAQLADQYGFSLAERNVDSRKNLPEALESLSGRIDSLFVAESAVLNLELRKIADYFLRNQVPILSQIPGSSDLGALMTLEAAPAEQGELVGLQALQILSGRKPDALPIHTPKKVDLVINLRTARTMNIKIPFQALSMATRVIK